jgi:hypothetical protein
VENSFGNIQILRSVTAQGDVLHQPTTPVVKGPHPSAKTSCAYPVPWKNIKTKALRKSLLRQVQWVQKVSALLSSSITIFGSIGR